jgi:chromate transport protein ChrA
MLGVVVVLHRMRREAWVSRFVEGLSPAVAVLMMYIAVKLVLGGNGGQVNWPTLALAIPSLAAFLLDAPPPVVLLAAGLVGIFLFR